ncbi:MAG TPA: hypothetical protein VEI54_05040, partial [Candidatus Limnocylindrales bacterium]|nr:hypothetical protein [Candidatus Limnocylindrales bacterium]
MSTSQSQKEKIASLTRRKIEPIEMGLGGSRRAVAKALGGASRRFAWAALVALWVSLCGGVAAQGQATTEPGAISGSGAGKTSQSELLWQKL